MTRGRRKDLTIPPSRALVQQRDYRARKAKYLADLENRVRIAEEENADLRLEVGDLQRQLDRACGRPSFLSNDVVNASAQLLAHLNEAASSLTRFRDIAFKDTPELPPGSPPNTFAASNSFPTPPLSHDTPLSHSRASSTVDASAVNNEAHSVSRSVSNSPSISFLSSIAISRRTSSTSTSGLPSTSASASAATSGATSASCSMNVMTRLPQPPRDNRMLTLPPLVRREQPPSTHHSYTLPPLRLPSPGEEHSCRSTRTLNRSHPYSQSYESFASSRLTPSNWSELSQPGHQSRSSLPSHSEDSDEECDDEEGPRNDAASHQRLFDRGERRDAGHQRDYSMHDDTPDSYRSSSPQSYRNRAGTSSLSDGSSDDGC